MPDKPDVQPEREMGPEAASPAWRAMLKTYYRKLPLGFRKKVSHGRMWLSRRLRRIGHSPANLPAVQALVDRRGAFVKRFAAHPALPGTPAEWPFIDVSIVCFNSRKWLDGFMRSLADQDYPLERINLRFVDHGSSDGTVAALRAIETEHGAAFASIEILERPNRGFGAGHNAGIRSGSSPFCLVTNADLTFQKDALTRIVAEALADEAEVACWELRQKPYEHPKFYDPVTGETNWCAHACVLLRRSAFEAVGGYDENIFMYGEDVELSYRLRLNGFHLRYCPSAVVWHFTYEHEHQIKPLQYTGSMFANLYLRLKYGTWRDIAIIPIMAARLLTVPEVYPGSRADLKKSLKRLLGLVPQALRQRRRSPALFPFHQADYEYAREGAFVAISEELERQPLVSIVTRTYRGREAYLLQAMLSVMRQTYPQIEHIIVEDGGDTLRDTVERVAKGTGARITYLPMPKVGRSPAGNAGLAAAQGEYAIFLDDDDLFFADHVELLVHALQSDPEAAAAYSLAWDVPTDPTRLPEGHLGIRIPILHEAMEQPFDPEILRHHNYIPIQAILFRRKLYLERGGFEEDLDALEDWNLWNRYAVGNRFVYAPKVTSLFRTPADSRIAQKRIQVLTEAYEPVLARTLESIRKLELTQVR